MPSVYDLLLVVAQLAVAFAGFASVATAFGDREASRVDAGRLANMLIASLVTAGLALVPFLPAFFGVPDGAAWRGSAVLALLTMVIALPGMTRRTLRMRRYAGFTTLGMTANYAQGGIAAAGFAACALGVPPANPAAGYALGLVALLFVSGTLFFLVILSVLRPHAPE